MVAKAEAAAKVEATARAEAGHEPKLAEDEVRVLLSKCRQWCDERGGRSAPSSKLNLASASPSQAQAPADPSAFAAVPAVFGRRTRPASASAASARFDTPTDPTTASAALDAPSRRVLLPAAYTAVPAVSTAGPAATTRRRALPAASTAVSAASTTGPAVSTAGPAATCRRRRELFCATYIVGEPASVVYAVDPPHQPQMTVLSSGISSLLQHAQTGANAGSHGLIPRDMIADPHAFFRTLYTYRPIGQLPAWQAKAPQSSPLPPWC